MEAREKLKTLEPDLAKFANDLGVGFAGGKAFFSIEEILSSTYLKCYTQKQIEVFVKELVEQEILVQNESGRLSFPRDIEITLENKNSFRIWARNWKPLFRAFNGFMVLLILLMIFNGVFSIPFVLKKKDVKGKVGYDSNPIVVQDTIHTIIYDTAMSLSNQSITSDVSSISNQKFEHKLEMIEQRFDLQIDNLKTQYYTLLAAIVGAFAVNAVLMFKQK